VYFGALPFAPITSAIYQRFHDHALFPSISGGFQQSWPLLMPVPEERHSVVTPVAFALCSSRPAVVLCTEASPEMHQDSVQAVVFFCQAALTLSPVRSSPFLNGMLNPALGSITLPQTMGPTPPIPLPLVHSRSTVMDGSCMCLQNGSFPNFQP
jgi:hypothetical protein